MYIHAYIMHSTSTVATCGYCCKVYSSISNLNLHQRNKHGRLSSKKLAKKGYSTTGTHLCITCGKTFSTRNNLLQHERNHGRCKLDCMYCSKKLITEKFLRRHIARAHSQLLAGQKKKPSEDNIARFSFIKREEQLRNKAGCVREAKPVCILVPSGSLEAILVESGSKVGPNPIPYRRHFFATEDRIEGPAAGRLEQWLQ